MNWRACEGPALHRRRRSAVPLATLALAGYTNAGKSTLFNRLTSAGVLADARMFATLDQRCVPRRCPPGVEYCSAIRLASYGSYPRLW